MSLTYDDFDRGMEGKDNLGDFIIGSLPTLIYVPEFITDSEQTALLNNVAFPSPPPSPMRLFCL